MVNVNKSRKFGTVEREGPLVLPCVNDGLLLTRGRHLVTSPENVDSGFLSDTVRLLHDRTPS